MGCGKKWTRLDACGGDGMKMNGLRSGFDKGDSDESDLGTEYDEQEVEEGPNDFALILKLRTAERKTERT